MQLQAGLLALITTNAWAIAWNDQLKVRDIGQVPTEEGKSIAATYMSSCCGIPEGDRTSPMASMPCEPRVAPDLSMLLVQVTKRRSLLFA